MKRLVLFILLVFASAPWLLSQQAFNANSLALIVAETNTNNTSASVYEIDKSTLNQTSPIQIIAISGTGTNAIRVSGSATSTLYAANSEDGTLLLFTGHNNTNTSNNANTLNPRAVVSVPNNGTYGIATTYTGISGNQTRGATTMDNINFYIGDQGGQYTNGATSPSPTGNLRAMKAFGGTVYVGRASTTSGVTEVGYSTALTGGSIEPLPGLSNNNNFQDFYFIQSGSNGTTYDILYIVRATSNTAGTIDKYSLVSGSWTSNGTYTTNFGGFGLAAEKSGSGTYLYLSTGAGALVNNSLRRLFDNSGYNENINITSNDVLYTISGNKIIKGVAFAPQPSQSLLTPPTLNPDVTNNDVDHNIEITFSDNPAWRAAVTSVNVGGTPLNPADYNLAAGILTLYPSAGNPLLTTAGSKNIAVIATGYSNATVTQVINAGAPVAANCSASINIPLAINSTRTVTVTAKDQYNNNVPNYNFVVDIVKTDNNATTNEQYIVDGNTYSASAFNVPLENPTGSNGQVTFTITIPAVVDNNDGVSVQVQLADGSTNVGTAFSFVNLTAQIDLSGMDPSSLMFYKGSTSNIVYRMKIDVTSNSTQLTNLVVHLGGTYTQSDISTDGVKLWSSPSATWGNQTWVASQSSASTGNGETITFSNLNITINPGTLYLFITVDIATNAVIGRSINVNQPQPSHFTFSSGTINNSNFISGNSHTIINDPQLSEVILPQFIQGLNGTNNSRIPFACRLTLSNLQPNTTYRYINQVIDGNDGPTVAGAGNVIFVNADNSFTRAASTSFSIPGQYGEFTTDASGSYTGWFITEPTGNARFTPGNQLYMRVRLNNGAGGTTAVWYLTTPNSFQVINFGTNNTANEGTGVYGPSQTTAKNFVFLYDNPSGTGRPLSGTFVESDGTSGGTAYPLYYQNNVDGQNGYWGSIIPNANNNGVLRLEYRYLANGNIHYAVTDNDGIWNGSNTVNPVNGLNALLIEPDANKYLDVVVYLEGPFDGTGMTTDLQQNGLIPLSQPFNVAPWNYNGTESVASVPVNIVDWVLVELRDADIPDNATPATKLSGWPKAFFLRNDGQIVDLDGTSLPNIGNPTITNNLFVVVRHRNHLDVLSNSGATLSGNNYVYNFSTGINQAYGGAAGFKQIGAGVYGMVSGDSDANGSVSNLDYNAWSADFGFTNTYKNSDSNMDGGVSNLDYQIWSTNFGIINPVYSPLNGQEIIFRSWADGKPD